MNNIDLEMLEQYTPQIIMDCQVALSSLDETNEGHKLAISSLMNVLDLLQETGIEPYSIGEVAEALKEEELYQISPEELAELKEAIAESEAEDARGEWYSTEEVLLELAKRSEQRRLVQAKTDKVSA